MTTKEEEVRSEESWSEGYRAACVAQLRDCLHRLGYEDIEAQKATWVTEREEAIAALRRICQHHGDNEWTNDLHLYDILTKHLEDYLEEGGIEV